jgi:polysaccharide export outer membrane protein
MKSKYTKILVALTGLALAVSAVAQSGPAANAFTTPAPKQAQAATAAVDPATYVIGADDLLNINVWKETEISRSVEVRPDGKISLPLVGEIQAAGLEPMQLQKQIADKLQSYIANPEVTVIVQEVKSKKFNVIGEVQRPGTYALSNPTTVLDALALCGGFRDFAKQSKIYVLRVNGDGSRQRIPFNYKRVVKGKSFDENVQLQSGDTVVVP